MLFLFWKPGTSTIAIRETLAIFGQSMHADVQIDKQLLIEGFPHRLDGKPTIPNRPRVLVSTEGKLYISYIWAQAYPCTLMSELMHVFVASIHEFKWSSQNCQALHLFYQ